MNEDEDRIDEVKAMGAELDKRAAKHAELDTTYEGDCPIPKAIEEARVTKAYRLLMPMSGAPWGSLVVDSVQDRLEVAGVRSGEKAVDDAIWGAWQDLQMDSESKLAHNCALVSGRAFALVWPTKDGPPEVTLDTPEQMIIKYREGSRRDKLAALRRWVDGDQTHATLYRPDGLYKFTQAKGSKDWTRRDVGEEAWPLPNRFGVVPVVELAVNRRLKPGAYGFARGEFEHCMGLLDRIQLLTFLGLVVAFWMGFPLRGVIGDKIIRDDDGKKLPPFDVHADSVFQLEDPKAQIAEYKAADRKNLSIYSELEQLAAVTKTPRHYFPQEQGMSNIAADTIRANEGAQDAKVDGHQASLGDGWEEFCRLIGRALPTPVELSARAEIVWRDHQSRSLAERADAATKLKDVLPWTAVAELALNATADQISRWQADRVGDAMSTLLAAATQPPPAPSIA